MKHKKTGPIPVTSAAATPNETASADQHNKDELTPEEQTQFAQAELVIGEGLAAFTKVGTELEKIRDQRLYRENHKSWAAYLRNRWRMSKSQANRLIVAAALVNKQLNPMGVIVKNEREIRSLTALEPEQIERAIEKAKAAAQRKKVPLTAKLLVEQLPKHPSQKKQAGALFRLPARFTKTLESAKAIRDDVAQAIKNTDKSDKNFALLKKVREFLDTLKRETPAL